MTLPMTCKYIGRFIQAIVSFLTFDQKLEEKNAKNPVNFNVLF